MLIDIIMRIGVCLCDYSTICISIIFRKLLIIFTSNLCAFDTEMNITGIYIFISETKKP